MVIFIFLSSEILKYSFVLIWSKNSRVILRRNLVPALECLIDVPPLIHFSIFFHPDNFFSTPSIPFPTRLINYWGKLNVCSVFCFASLRKEANTAFCFYKLVWRSQLIASYWTHFAELIECLLMFLLNVLLDLTDALDVLCRSFATQNSSASLNSTLTY